MLICAFAILPVVLSQYIGNVWINVLIIGVAAAGHQAFSANLYTLPSDTFPRFAVGSVIGIGGTVGAIGGALFSKYIGEILDSVGSYAPIFAAAGGAYFLALLSIHLLSPRLEPAKLEA
jgi:ACS family hexuronate transporter-like MFS transporter